MFFFFPLPLLGISFESYFYPFPVSKEWFCLTAWSLSFAVNNCWKVSRRYQVGQIIYPPAVLGCSAECIGTATKRGLLESLESRALLLMGKCVIALSLIPLLLPPMHPLLEGHTLYYTWSLWRFLALLGSTSPHDHLKLEAWESSAAWIAVVPRNLTELEKQF